MTPECIDELSKEFVTALSGLKLSDGKVNYTKSFGNIDRKATVFFTKIAWDKMQALVRDFSKEIAWHGLAYRGEDGKDEYYINHGQRHKGCSFALRFIGCGIYICVFE